MRSSAIGWRSVWLGERGERIATTMPFFEQHAWTRVTANLPVRPVHYRAGRRGRRPGAQPRGGSRRQAVSDGLTALASGPNLRAAPPWPSGPPRFLQHRQEAGGCHVGRPPLKAGRTREVLRQRRDLLASEVDDQALGDDECLVRGFTQPVEQLAACARVGKVQRNPLD